MISHMTMTRRSTFPQNASSAAKPRAPIDCAQFHDSQNNITFPPTPKLLQNTLHTQTCQNLSVLSSSSHPLDLVRWLLLALWAQPVSHRLLLDPYALPVKPLILALIIVACHHVAKTNSLAKAVLGVVRLIFLSSRSPHVLIFRASLTCHALVVGCC